MKTYKEIEITKEVISGLGEGKFYDIKFNADAIGFTSEMGRTIKQLFKKSTPELTPYLILLPFESSLPKQEMDGKEKFGFEKVLSEIRKDVDVATNAPDGEYKSGYLKAMTNALAVVDEYMNPESYFNKHHSLESKDGKVLDSTAEVLIDGLKKVGKSLFDKKEFYKAGRVNLVIDVLEEVLLQDKLPLSEL